MRKNISPNNMNKKGYTFGPKNQKNPNSILQFSDNWHLVFKIDTLISLIMGLHSFPFKDNEWLFCNTLLDKSTLLKYIENSPSCYSGQDLISNIDAYHYTKSTILEIIYHLLWWY